MGKKESPRKIGINPTPTEISSINLYFIVRQIYLYKKHINVKVIL